MADSGFCPRVYIQIECKMDCGEREERSACVGEQQTCASMMGDALLFLWGAYLEPARKEESGPAGVEKVFILVATRATGARKAQLTHFFGQVRMAELTIANIFLKFACLSVTLSWWTPRNNDESGARVES